MRTLTLTGLLLPCHTIFTHHLNSVLWRPSAPCQLLMMLKRRILVAFEESDTGSDVKPQKKIAVSLHLLKSHALNSNATDLSGQRRY